jgi:hypothetical protein
MSASWEGHDLKYGQLFGNSVECFGKQAGNRVVEEKESGLDKLSQQEFRCSS